MVGQSESLPMMTPTVGLVTDTFPQPTGRAPGPIPYRGRVVAEHRDMPDLPARAYLLAVQVDPRSRIGGEEVVQTFVDAHPPGRSTEDIGHDHGRSDRG